MGKNSTAIKSMGSGAVWKTRKGEGLGVLWFYFDMWELGVTSTELRHPSWLLNTAHTPGVSASHKSNRFILWRERGCSPFCSWQQKTQEIPWCAHSQDRICKQVKQQLVPSFRYVVWSFWAPSHSRHTSFYISTFCSEIPRYLHLHIGLREDAVFSWLHWEVLGSVTSFTSARFLYLENTFNALWFPPFVFKGIISL